VKKRRARVCEETIVPNEPKITSGEVIAHSDRVLVA
jgi:hypothetical protein